MIGVEWDGCLKGMYASNEYEFEETRRREMQSQKVHGKPVNVFITRNKGLFPSWIFSILLYCRTCSIKKRQLYSHPIPSLHIQKI